MRCSGYVRVKQYEGAQEKAIDLTIGESKVMGSMAADSFNTLILHRNA